MEGASAPKDRPRPASSKPSPWIPRLAFAICCAPIVAIAVRIALGKLSANPIEGALNRLGWWTLTLLLCSLACTPLQLVLGWKWPLRLRRLLGLFAFFYACCHFLTYAGLDQQFNLGEIWKDVVKRKFITVGMATLLLLIPLAVTSTNKMMRRLGFPRWKLLHRLAYLAGITGVVHFVWRVKADLREPLIFAAVLGVLLCVRIVDRFRKSLAIKARGDRSMVSS